MCVQPRPNRVAAGPHRAAVSLTHGCSLCHMWLQVRAVVFRMNDNHLLVYNPVAPTEEFLQQLDALQVLPTRAVWV